MTLSKGTGHPTSFQSQKQLLEDLYPETHFRKMRPFLMHRDFLNVLEETAC